MTFFAVGIGAAGLLGGALISSNASKSAADTQQQSSRDATAAQVGMFNTQVGLQEPWRQTGIAGLGKLNDLLGLKPAPSPTMTLTQGADGVFSPSVGPAGFNEQAYLAANPDVAQYIAEHPPGSVGYTDAATHYRLFGQKEGRPLAPPAAQLPAPTGAPAADATGTPQPGSLLTDPGAGMHAFTAADFTADPGYQFRQDQQQKALTAAASAQGGFGSGKYLKDAMTYSGNLASQEYGAAYGRYNTDQTNQYNRTVNDQTNTFNRLAAVSGIGQTAANTLTGAAGTLGGQIGSNIVGAGNAAAAGQVGSANALNGAIGQGVSMYTTNQLLNRFPMTGYGGSGFGGYGGGAGTVGDFPISYYG